MESSKIDLGATTAGAGAFTNSKRDAVFPPRARGGAGARRIDTIPRMSAYAAQRRVGRLR